MKSEWFFILRICILLVSPLTVSASVVINEIAWMGTAVSSTDEWIELYNNGSETADLTGWVLNIQDKKDIAFSGSISANSFFLIERTNDETVPGITADLIYTGALVDTGEILILKDKNGNEVQKVIGGENWQNIGGDKNTKQTAQYTSSGWITATATPKAINFIPLEPPTSQQQTQPPSQFSGSDSSSYIPPEKLPKIKADAGADKTVVVGATAEFRGQAFGLKDEPLNNARFLWTFGDGTSKEGKNITHIYRYPGDYIVVLDITSGDYSASDRALIKATANQLFISEVKPSFAKASEGAAGFDSWIEFENKSKQEIDISGSQIRANGKVFTFPQSSRILSGAYLVVPSEVSGLVLSSEKGVIEFLYSGGFKADVFNYDGVLKSGQSFNRSGELSFVGAETPGGKNVSADATAASSVNKNPITETETKGQKTVSEILSEKTAEQESEKENKANRDINAGAIILTRSDNHSKIYFIAAILAVVLFGAGAILFIRRQRGV